MVSTYEKGKGVQLSEHFSTTVYDCQCKYSECRTTYVDSDWIDAAEQLWALAGALTLTSGFRCTRHNLDEGGKPGSIHLLGKAGDVKSAVGLTGIQLANHAKTIARFEHGGIGLYRRYPNLVHLDVRGYAARWNY